MSDVSNDQNVLFLLHAVFRTCRSQWPPPGHLPSMPAGRRRRVGRSRDSSRFFRLVGACLCLFKPCVSLDQNTGSEKIPPSSVQPEGWNLVWKTQLESWRSRQCAGPVVVSTLTPGGVKAENNFTNGMAKSTSFPVSMSLPCSASRHNS